MYISDYSSRGRQFLTKFNDDLEPEDSGYRLQLHLEGTEKSDRSRLSMAHHPSGETTSGTSSEPHEDSLASEVIVEKRIQIMIQAKDSRKGFKQSNIGGARYVKKTNRYPLGDNLNLLILTTG